MWQSVILFLFMGFSIHAEEETKSIVSTNQKAATVKAAAVKTPETEKAATVKAAAVKTPETEKAATVKAAVVKTPETEKAATVKAAVVKTPETEKAATVKAAVAETQEATIEPAVVVEKSAKEPEVEEKQSKAFAGHKADAHSYYCRYSAQNKLSKRGFFSAYFTNSFNIFQDFVFHGRSLRLGYGGKLFRDNDFELSINISHSTPSFGLKYEQAFLKDRKWFPGVDVSLLFGLIDEKDRFFRELLAVGLEGGPFLSTFISKYYSLVVRTGLSYTVPVSGNVFEEEPNFYISLGFKRFLR